MHWFRRRNKKINLRELKKLKRKFLIIINFLSSIHWRFRSIKKINLKKLKRKIRTIKSKLMKLITKWISNGLFVSHEFIRTFN